MMLSPTSGQPRKGAGVFCHEQWNIGAVHQSAASIVANGLTAPVHWLPPPSPWVFLADPSCRMRPDGTLEMLAERLDYWSGRGEIWRATVPAGADPSTARFSPLFQLPVHLSYPSPFIADDGGACLTAESWEAGAALLWREGAEGWTCVGRLFDGRPVVDPTLWRDADRWWLFCTFQDDGPNRKLHLFHAPTSTGPWVPHRRNPVVDDPASARPAGPLFRAGDVLVRPSQDCSRTYGGAVVLNAVTRLDPDEYREEPIRRLWPVSPYSSALHTFCPAGDWTLVDGKAWRFHLLEAVRKVIVPLRRALANPPVKKR